MPLPSERPCPPPCVRACVCMRVWTCAKTLRPLYACANVPQPHPTVPPLATQLHHLPLPSRTHLHQPTMPLCRRDPAGAGRGDGTRRDSSLPPGPRGATWPATGAEWNIGAAPRGQLKKPRGHRDAAGALGRKFVFVWRGRAGGGREVFCAGSLALIGILALHHTACSVKPRGHRDAAGALGIGTGVEVRGGGGIWCGWSLAGRRRETRRAVEFGTSVIWEGEGSTGNVCVWGGVFLQRGVNAAATNDGAGQYRLEASGPCSYSDHHDSCLEMVLSTSLPGFARFTGCPGRRLCVSSTLMITPTV
eukprot:31607-Chlamydomonas_euryale.AAC.1